MAERPTWKGPGSDSTVMVLGLGRFGTAVATTLAQLGVEVIGVDASASIVARAAESLDHVIEADTTSRTTLEQLGVLETDTCVVGIGTDLEASILTTSALVDLGHPSILAKAMSADHGRILDRIGAHRVVFPENDMGVRIAHSVAGRMIDWFELDADFALAETQAPTWLVGRSLAEVALRGEHGVTVVAVKPSGGSFTYAEADTRIGDGDVLVVAGPPERTERFCGTAG